jgi:hypothetical protein
MIKKDGFLRLIVFTIVKIKSTDKEIDVNTLLQRGYFTVGLLDAQLVGQICPKIPHFCA